MTPVRFVAKDSTYGELQETLFSMHDLRAFPLVDSKSIRLCYSISFSPFSGRMTLLGSISRSQLAKLIESRVGIKARQAEARRRIQTTISTVDERMKMGQTKVEELFAAGPIKENEKPETSDEVKGKEKKKFMVSKVNRQLSDNPRTEDAALRVGNSPF